MIAFIIVLSIAALCYGAMFLVLRKERPLTGDQADLVHNLAIEMSALAAMADRVAHADDWCSEATELRERLERVHMDLGTIVGDGY